MDRKPMMRMMGNSRELYFNIYIGSSRVSRLETYTLFIIWYVKTLETQRPNTLRIISNTPSFRLHPNLHIISVHCNHFKHLYVLPFKIIISEGFPGMLYCGSMRRYEVYKIFNYVSNLSYVNWLEPTSHDAWFPNFLLA